MNCCNHNSSGQNETGRKQHKGPMSHMWMMALCCAAPLVLLFALSPPVTGFPGVRAALIGALPFICPIMMIGMIPMMFMHGKNHDGCDEERPESTVAEDKQTEHKRLR